MLINRHLTIVLVAVKAEQHNGFYMGKKQCLQKCVHIYLLVSSKDNICPRQKKKNSCQQDGKFPPGMTCVIMPSKMTAGNGMKREW